MQVIKCYLVKECLTTVTIPESIFLDKSDANKHANEMQRSSEKCKLNIKYIVSPINLFIGEKFIILPKNEPDNNQEQ